MNCVTGKAIAGKAYESLGLKPEVLDRRPIGDIYRTGLIPVSEGQELH